MKNVISKCFRLGGAAFALISIIVAYFAPCQANAQTAVGWPHLKYALYFTSRDIESLLSNPDQFKRTMEYFAPVKAVHIYLEGASRGEINVPLLKNVADKFRSMGFRVSGAMVPVGRQGPSVYNNAEDIAALERRMRAMAQVFDNIILDDWLFTTATDPKSVEDRGIRSWANYRTNLLIVPQVS